MEERTFRFARTVRELVGRIPKTTSNLEDARQLVRSSGSVAANYLEANNALSKRDFRRHVRISTKEAKESGLWLRLLDTGAAPTLAAQRSTLVSESRELVKILSTIYTRTK